MLRFLDAFEPPLPDLEDDYRRHFLRSDAVQATVAIAVLLLLSIFIIPSDYLVLGPTFRFYVMLAGRVFALLVGIPTAFVLNRTRDLKVYDRALLAIMIVAVVLVLLADSRRPPEFQGQAAIDVVLLLSIYLVVPNPLTVRASLALVFTAVSLILLLVKHASPVAVNSDLAVHLSANVLGFIISARLYNHRRLQFKAQTEEKLAREELRRLATTDALTGLDNRRALIQRGLEEFARSHRYNRPYSILIMDIDNFKQVNDTYGHAAGDEVLRQFARQIVGRMRKQDVFGRLGGEEFAMLLPETRLHDALTVSERLRRLCAESTYKVEDGEEVRITLSIGLVERTEDDASFDSLQKRADDMLYRAKQTGRNCVMWE
jgi:diguanylate cyclase (GGDEF)-like protein